MSEKVRIIHMSDKEVNQAWYNLMMECALRDDEIWQYWEDMAETYPYGLTNYAGGKPDAADLVGHYYGLGRADMEVIEARRNQAHEIAYEEVTRGQA